MFEIIKVRKDFGDRPVLDEVSIKIGCGQRVGLVGSNGCGKSTLLKILAGCLEPDAGTIHTHGNVRVGYLAQALDDVSALTVGDLLSSQFNNAIQTMRLCEREMEFRHDDSELLETYSKAVDHFEAAGGYQTEARMEAILGGLGMADIALDRSLTALSGGQKTRLALARVLLLDADLLLLDEPTNNLDVDALEWLEETLLEHRGSCVIVSHDRRLLDRVTTRTIELDHLTATLTEYGGNYSWYQKRKAENEARQWREYEEQQDRIKQLKQNIVDHRQKALVTENSTVHDFFRGRSKKVAATAKARESRLERLLSQEHRVERPRNTDTMRLTLSGHTNHGGRLVEINNCTIERSGKTIIENVELEVYGGKKIAVVGANGSGKSTLLELIVGNMTGFAGRINRRSGLTIGYLPQHQETLDENSTVLEYFLLQTVNSSFDNHAASSPSNRRPELCDESTARTFLHRFLFTRDEVFKTIRQLSRGERTKLILATFMAKPPDLLVLDEPTNHLDLPTLDCLEKALISYRGTLIVVSHDRFFLDQIAAELIWNVKDQKVFQTFADNNS